MDRRPRRRMRAVLRAGSARSPTVSVGALGPRRVYSRPALAREDDGVKPPRRPEPEGGAMADLDGKTVAILATHMVEEAELVETRRYLSDAGAETVLVAPEPGEIQSFHDG